MTTINDATPAEADSLSPPAVDLSIVIVNWNTRQLLRECIASVLANAGKLAIELFVVDNASSDGSAEMVRNNFPTVKLIENDRNRGFAAANNQALRVARGRFVLLLNSDTIALEDVLEKSVKYLDEHADVAVMGCRVLNPDRTLQPTCFEYPSLLNLFLLTSGLSRLPWPRFLGKYQMNGWKRDTERDVDVVTGCYMLVRRAVLPEVGLMDESFFFFGEETDWCRCFRKHGWRVRFAPVGEIIHYGGASAKQSNYHRENMLNVAIIHLHHKHGGLIGAFAAWTMMFVFCCTRYALWLVVSLVHPRDRAVARREMFGNILRHFPAINQTTEQPQ
jgi:GT2 family glycosyltransferase